MLRACGVRWKNFNLRTRGENLFEGPGGGNKSKTCKLYTPLKIYPRPLRIMEMIMQHCKKSLTLMCHSLQQKKTKTKNLKTLTNKQKTSFALCLSVVRGCEGRGGGGEGRGTKKVCVHPLHPRDLPPPQTCSQKGRCQHHLHMAPNYKISFVAQNQTRPAKEESSLPISVPLLRKGSLCRSDFHSM